MAWLKVVLPLKFVFNVKGFLKRTFLLIGPTSAQFPLAAWCKRVEPSSVRTCLRWQAMQLCTWITSFQSLCFETQSHGSCKLLSHFRLGSSAIMWKWSENLRWAWASPPRVKSSLMMWAWPLLAFTGTKHQASYILTSLPQGYTRSLMLDCLSADWLQSEKGQKQKKMQSDWTKSIKTFLQEYPFHAIPTVFIPGTAMTNAVEPS